MDHNKLAADYEAAVTEGLAAVKERAQMMHLNSVKQAALDRVNDCQDAFRLATYTLLEYKASKKRPSADVVAKLELRIQNTKDDLAVAYAFQNLIGK